MTHFEYLSVSLGAETLTPFEKGVFEQGLINKALLDKEICRLNFPNGT